MNTDTVLAVPMGDPAGIGPEIVIKALSCDEISSLAKCIVIGDKRVFAQAMTFPGMPKLEINVLEEERFDSFKQGALNILDLNCIDPADFAMGEVSGLCGAAAYKCIERSIALAMSGKADAVVTPPINKESLRAGNVPFIGHTEIFGALTDTPDPLTVFEVRGMRVFFLTRHVSLAEACRQVKKERIVDYVHRIMPVLEQLGAADKPFAVAGLNPHSGEHGLFGNEEVDEVIPAVEALQAEGFNVVGPVGADSVFYQALEGRYSGVLSLYHDQGHIATKTVDFYRTISITAGMPILRTSVDHGTSFSRAGKGTANSVSMEEALRVAVKYAPAFTKRAE